MSTLSCPNRDQTSCCQAAYSYYHAAVTVPVTQLMKDALIVAKNQWVPHLLNSFDLFSGMDVFNALDLGRNDEFIKGLKFGKGDGSLRYYFYNYLCPDVSYSIVGRSNFFFSLSWSQAKWV